MCRSDAGHLSHMKLIFFFFLFHTRLLCAKCILFMRPTIPQVLFSLPPFLATSVQSRPVPSSAVQSSQPTDTLRRYKEERGRRASPSYSPLALTWKTDVRKVGSGQHSTVRLQRDHPLDTETFFIPLPPEKRRMQSRWRLIHSRRV